MKILITADLHYDISRSRAAAKELSRRALEEGGEAIVLVGDSAGADLNIFKECLALFAPFTGLKLLVPGNHCLWCRAGEGSIDRYERLLPQACAEMGFSVLDHGPVVLGEEGPDGVGLAGTIGWYDYSFADQSLGLPVDFYRAKVAPGAAAYLGGYEDILHRHRASLTERHLGMGSQWRDGQHVKLGMTDEEFLAALCHKLKGQLEDLSRRCGRIVVFSHHVPFIELVPAGRPDRFAFAAAYMGAGKLGDAILEFPKVTHVYCGHSHWPGRINVGHVAVVNVGSTYTDKRLEILVI